MNKIHNNNLARIIKTNSKIENTENLPDIINRLTENFRHETSLVNIIKMFNNTPMKLSYPSTYHYENYEIIVGSNYNLESFSENLSLLNMMGISSCPKLIKSILNHNEKYRLMILQHSSKEENIKSYKEQENNIEILSKTKFIEELIQFSNLTNLYNPIIEDINSWKITNNNSIIIDDWSCLEQFESERDKYNYFQNLKKMCNLVLY